MEGTGSTIIRHTMFGGSCNAFANRLLNEPNPSRTEYKFKHHFSEFIVPVYKHMLVTYQNATMTALLIPYGVDL